MKKGWEIKKLSDIGKVFNGNSINEKVKKDNYTDLVGGYPFIATKDVGFDSEIDYDNRVRIPFAEKAQFKIAPANTPLICAEGGSAGRKIGYTNQDVCFGNKLFALVPNRNVDSKFIFYYYFSSSFQKYFTTEIVGIIGGVSMNKFKDIEIPLPPLLEQQRIVAILDEAFSAIAKAKANAHQNLQNAKELFESYLQGVFENKGEGWETKEFGSIIEVLTDYHANGSYEVLKANVLLKEVEDYAWMVRSTDFENDFENAFRYIDEHGYNFLNKSKVYGGEIIMSKIGNAGNVYLMPNIDRPCSLAMNLFLIRLNEKKAVPHFVFHYLKSYSGEFQIKSRLQGATTKTITKDNVRNIIIPLPQLKTQQIIVQKLDALNTETKKLESIYHQKLNALEELKKSVLQKAFSGQLSESGFSGLKNKQDLKKAAL